jgi:hypothetical protein
MGQLSAHSRHLDRMEAAVAVCRRRFIETGGLEDDQNTVTRLAASLVREIEGLTETITDNAMPDCHDVILDEISASFMRAIEARDDRRSPESKAIYAAEISGRL